jgi:mannose-6-phosphate isomerase-like protein (cupin superfamily)
MHIAACALLILGQAAGVKSSVVTFLTRDQVLHAIQTVPEQRPGYSWADLMVTPEYSVMEVRRTAPDRSEVHAAVTDIWYVLRGSATLITGGSAVDPLEIEPGELRGRGVSNGDIRQIHGGEVLVIPAGIPHWISKVEQGEVVYLVIKVPSRK